MLERFKWITTFVFDVDGVLTDGMVSLSENGLQERRMSIKDGFALQLAIKKGYRVLVISGGDAPPVIERLNKLGIRDVHMKVVDKKSLLEEYLAKHNIELKEVLFMGDDIPDLEAMNFAGLPCAPADAAPEIRQAARYISRMEGGKGCVRDVIEKVLRLNEHWELHSRVTSS